MKRTCTALALSVLVAFTSCNSNEEGLNPEDGLTPILLGTGMPTKAPVNSSEGLNTKGIGIFAITTKNTTATEAITDWTLAKVMENEKPTSIAANGGGITLSLSYYYPTDATDYVKFMAFHPYISKGTSGDNYLEVSDAAAPKLNFTLTGQEDVMYAEPAIGNKATTTAQSLKFQHALTQITFHVIKDAAMSESLKVAGIQFTQVNTKAKMDIETGTVSDWGTSGNIIAFNAPTTADQIEIPASTATATKVGEPVMLEPGAASFKLSIATSAKTYTDIEVKPTGEDATFAKGKSYVVTITFNVSDTDPGKEILLSAEVQEWVEGGTGSGTVTDRD